MKHNITIAVAALAVVFAGCNARPGSEIKVTVAGCVQSAEQGLASADAKEINKFMLTNVAPSAAAAPSAAPNAPAAANEPAAPNPSAAPNDRPRSDQAPSDAAAPPATAPTISSTMYMLDGKASELRPHLNHQVEVTGHLDDQAKDASSTTVDRRPELHVDSVRMIAASCNP